MEMYDLLWQLLKGAAECRAQSKVNVYLLIMQFIFTKICRFHNGIWSVKFRTDYM